MDALYGNYFHTQGQGIEMFLYMNNRNLYNHAVAMRTQFEKVVGSPQFKAMLKRTFVDGDQFKIGLFEIFNDYIVLNYAKTLMENIDADMNQRGGGGRGHGRAPAPQQSRRDRSHKVTTPQTFTRRAILRAAVPAPARRRRELFARANTEGFLQGLSKLISKNSQTHGVSMEQIEKSHAFLFNLISNRCRKGFLEAYALNDETVREKAVAQVETVCKTLIPQVAKANKIVGITDEVVRKMVDDIKTSAEKTHTSGMTVAKKNHKIQWQKNSKTVSSMESTLTNWYSSVVSSLLENGPVQFVLNFFSKKKSNASTRMLRYVNKNTGFVHGEKGIKLLYTRNASRKAQRFERRQKQFAKVSETYQKDQKWKQLNIFFLAIQLANVVAQSTVTRQALGLEREASFGKGFSAPREPYRLPKQELETAKLLNIARMEETMGIPSLSQNTTSIVTLQANQTTDIRNIPARIFNLTATNTSSVKKVTESALLTTMNMTRAVVDPNSLRVGTTVALFGNHSLTDAVAHLEVDKTQTNVTTCPAYLPIKGRKTAMSSYMADSLLSLVALSPFEENLPEISGIVLIGNDGTIGLDNAVATLGERKQVCLPGGIGGSKEESCLLDHRVRTNTVALVHIHPFTGEMIHSPPGFNDFKAFVNQLLFKRIPYHIVCEAQGCYAINFHDSSELKQLILDEDYDTVLGAYSRIIKQGLESPEARAKLPHFYNCSSAIPGGIISTDTITTVSVPFHGKTLQIKVGFDIQFRPWHELKNGEGFKFTLRHQYDDATIYFDQSKTRYTKLSARDPVDEATFRDTTLATFKKNPKTASIQFPSEPPTSLRAFRAILESPSISAVLKKFVEYSKGGSISLSSILSLLPVWANEAKIIFEGSRFLLVKNAVPLSGTSIPVVARPLGPTTPASENYRRGVVSPRTPELPYTPADLVYMVQTAEESADHRVALDIYYKIQVKYPLGAYPEDLRYDAVQEAKQIVLDRADELLASIPAREYYDGQVEFVQGVYDDFISRGLTKRASSVSFVHPFVTEPRTLKREAATPLALPTPVPVSQPAGEPVSWKGILGTVILGAASVAFGAFTGVPLPFA